MKKLITILLLFSLKSYSQLPDPLMTYIIVSDSFEIKYKSDSIKVKILKVKGYQIVMKTMERPRVKLMTFCKCPYRKGSIIWIRKPQI